MLVVFVVFAWSSSADSASGALRIPLVDRLRKPAARSAHGHVGLGQLVLGERPLGDAELFGDFGQAEVMPSHRFRLFRRGRGRLRGRTVRR
nr:MAG TPA: hypothetical protein [Caudoviricetes sp.]